MTVLSQRLREAKRLLADTNLPITAIARQTGFCNAGYLSNSFRRAVGVSLKAWCQAHPKIALVGERGIW